MKNRRGFLLTLTVGVVALAVVAIPTIADELLGVITKVDVEGKKLTVEKKDGEEVVVTITDVTEYVGKQGSQKVDLEKLSKNLAKTQDAGKKGIFAKIEHEKGVASKIYAAGKKKAEPPKEDK